VAGMVIDSKRDVDVGLLCCNTVSEDGGSMFLRNIGYLPTSPHGFTTQETNIDIFTAVRTSNFTL
jgi:hypothetical protein